MRNDEELLKLAYDEGLMYSAHNDAAEILSFARAIREECAAECDRMRMAGINLSDVNGKLADAARGARDAYALMADMIRGKGEKILATAIAEEINACYLRSGEARELHIGLDAWMELRRDAPQWITVNGPHGYRFMGLFVTPKPMAGFEVLP